MTGPLRGAAFPFRITGGRVAQHHGPDKIADNLRHLLSTRLGERVMLRDYGGGVHQRLQESNNHTLRTLIRHEIEQALRTHLPQVRLLGPIRLTHADGELTVAFDYRIDPGTDPATTRIQVTLTRSP